MKKALISFVSIVVLLGMVGMAQAITLDTDLVLPGEWTELYISGFPGQHPNSIRAQSIDIPGGYTGPPLIEWSLNNMILDRILSTQTTPDGMTEYTTRYEGGTFMATGFSAINLEAIVVAYILDGGYEEGNITMTGSGGFFMTAYLTETEPIITEVVDGLPVSGHSGVIRVDELRINELSSVPEPTAMLLLGIGLVGIAGIRRKYKS
jgi:hypothetical protein